MSEDLISISNLSKTYKNGLKALNNVSLNIKKGDEIITTPLTFVSTNHSILYENLQPVFADVDEHLCLDAKSVREKITDKKTIKILNP